MSKSKAAAGASSASAVVAPTEDIISKEKGSQKVQQEGIGPFLSFIESKEREFFKAKDFVTLYDLIFKMCIQRDPFNWSETMYELYTHSILNYLLDKVAPALERCRKEFDTALLREWKHRWSNQKLIVQGLAKLFMYLDRFYTPNCFPADDHEILTNRGFLKLKEFEAAMEESRAGQAALPLRVACYNPTADAFNYYPPAKLIKVEGEHSLVSFVSAPEKLDGSGAPQQRTDVSLLCTPNHDVWFSSSDKPDFHKASAANVVQLAHATDDCVIRFQARAQNGMRKVAPELPFAAPLGLVTDDQVAAFLWLYGYWLGNGSMNFDSEFISIESSTEQDREELDRVFARLQLTKLPSCLGSERVDKEGYTREEKHFAIHSPSWFAYFAREYHGKYAGGAEWFASHGSNEPELDMAADDVDQSNAPKPAQWFFSWMWKRSTLTRDQLRVVLAGLRHADGNQTAKENDASPVPTDEKESDASIGVSCERFRDELVIVALHAGYAASVSTTQGDNAWRVHYSDASRASMPALQGHEDVRRVESWKGSVWCCTVPTRDHLIVVRRAPADAAPSKPIIVGNTDGILTLKEQGYKSYKEQIFDVYAPYARQAILNAIEKERNNEEQDRHLLQEAVDVFVQMGYNYNSKKLAVYTNDLEKYVIENAGAYYQRKSREWMDNDSCPVYLDKVEKVLAAEAQRVQAYLNRSTQEPLAKECYVQLLKTHQRELLRKKTGLHHLLSINAVDDLSRLYRLYKGYEGDLEPIAEMFEDFVQQQGTAVVDAAKAAQSTPAPKEGEEEKKDGAASSAPPADANHQLVRNLIGLHAQYNEIVTVCFEKTQVMQKSLKKAFEEFINKDNRVSKLLAKFVNDVLKKGSKVNVRDVESTLDNVVFLYGYISEKDVFERDYQVFLSNRLLMGLCESEHSEKSMIAKLKTECGYQWTNKLEGMFKDVQLSKDLMSQFKKMYDEDAVDVTLDVNVCTTGYWPSSRIVPCIMPKELQSACEKYKRFYLNQHSGHKLEWRYDQGQAEVTVDFSPTCRKALVVSTYQMMVLLVFNSFKRVTYKQMLDVTGVPKSELANHLLSLCHPKVAVLLKRPNTKKLEDSHQFMINPAYKNALKKVTIPLLRAVDSEESSEEENKCIELQRRHQMDAAIVRIMKTRKTMRHNLLVAEVISQLSARFKPRPNDIKKRVEALIEQEYMERDPNERGQYNYKA